MKTMKRLIFTTLMLFTLCVNNSNAQNVVREGKVFKSKSNRSTHKADTLVTTYKWETGGKQHPIIINKSTGSCYIWKKSKNNKMYKMYMKPDVSQQICRELNIEYKSRSKK